MTDALRSLLAQKPSSSPPPAAFTLEDARAFLGIQPDVLLVQPDGSPRGSAHSFSRKLAKDHGITAAILLKYLAYRTRKSTKIRDGRQWHYESIDDLAERYPYLSASAIHETLRALVPKVLLRGNYNRRKADKTWWYTFADPMVARAAEEDLLYFDPNHAKLYGLPEAIILHNVLYWLVEHRKKNPKVVHHRTSPTELARLLPISRATVARALKRLVEKGALVKNPSPTGKLPEYRLPGSTRP